MVEQAAGRIRAAAVPTLRRRQRDRRSADAVTRRRPAHLAAVPRGGAVAGGAAPGGPVGRNLAGGESGNEPGPVVEGMTDHCSRQRAGADTLRLALGAWYAFAAWRLPDGKHGAGSGRG